MINLRNLVCRFHDNLGDSYKSYNKVDPRNLKVENLVGSIKNMRIKYGFGQINHTTDKMVREFCKVAKDENFARVVDVKNPEKIIEFILSTSLIAREENTIATMLAR